MLPTKLRSLLRHLVLAGLAGLLPLFYLTGVTLGNGTAAAAALAAGGVVAALAALAFE